MSLHRRKGGALDAGKKTIVVRYEGREHSVSWFSGTSDEAISRTIDNALGLPLGNPAVIRDPEDGSALVVSDSLPDGIILHAKLSVEPGSNGNGNGNGNTLEGGGVPFMQRSVDGFHGSSETSKGGVGSISSGGGKEGGDGEAKIFRGELLKFERVNAHLANERTWLAWVRTALSVLGVALSLLSLEEDMGSTAMESVVLVLGVAFVLCTLFTYLTGWLRYVRMTEVLSWTGSQVKAKFGRFKLKYFTWFLGICLVLTGPLYLLGGLNVEE